MPEHFFSRQFSIGKRMLLLCSLIMLAFCANVVIMLSTSDNIRELTNSVISEDVAVVLQNSLVTRELSSVFSETSLFMTTFHLNPDEKVLSSVRILDDIGRIMERDMEDELRKGLAEFRFVLSDLFGHCNEINQKLFAVQKFNAITLSLFTKLEEYISRVIVQRVLDGEDSLAYEQVGAIIPSYREMLTEVSLAFSTFRPISDNSEQAEKIAETLATLHLRLRTLLAADSAISTLGQSLMNTVDDLKRAYVEVWAEQENLIKKLAVLDLKQKKMLEAMDEIDSKTGKTAQLINQTINDITSTSTRSIAAISIVVALIVAGMTFLFLHFQIRRPMTNLKQGIDLVSEGKLDTRIDLGPDHEWKAIETAINKMIVDLGSFYERLQKSNVDLTSMNRELEERSAMLEQEIDQRRRAEEALVLSEERYRRFFDDDLSGSFIANPEGTILACNPAFMHMFRLPDDALNNNFSLRSIFSDSAAADEFFKVLSERQTLKFEESGFRRFDGSLLFATATITGTTTERERLTEIKGHFIDETNRREAEKKSIKLEEQLQHAQKMEAIGTLAGGVAHDLNNILAGVVSYPDLLLMKMEPDHPYRKIIETIQESGKKMAAIVQDLLTLARRGVVVNEVVNLNKVINDFITTPEYARMLSYHPDVEIKLELAKDLKNIEGTPFHLAKTVMNLVSNAAESIEKQGLVTIKTINKELLADESKTMNLSPGEYAIISVADNGTGIDEENRNRIFEPFFTKKEMGRSGTGLGLAVVWGTVQDHGGHIEVHSIKGEGTTFTIYLPITKKVMKEKHDISDPVEYRGRGEKILVVDDTRSQRDIASEMLVELGYEADTVASGEEAVEFLKNNDADCILLDMIMAPGIDGLDTYRRILEFKPGQKAILTSGYSETNRVKQAQNIGATIYLRKPYTMEQVGIALRKELSAA